MDQPPAGNALLYANRQRFVMLISSNLVGCSTGKSAASLREDIELAANSQRASERLYKPVSRGRERLMSESIGYFFDSIGQTRLFLLNGRFGSLFGLKSDICRGPSCAKGLNRSRGRTRCGDTDSPIAHGASCLR